VHAARPCITRRALLLATGATQFAGCAALSPTPQTDALAAWPPGLPGRVELDAVPFFAQTPYHCGPAALATVLVHAGFAQATPEALADRVFLPAREGALQVEMLAAARRAGAVPVALPGELRVLCDELAAGQPSVVLLNLGLALAPRWHYAVLVGYDRGARELVLRSGTTRREVTSFALFERTWARGGHWAIAAVAPGRWPASVREADAVQAAVGFERAVAQPAQRLAVFASLVSRWPDNLPGLIGAGNAHAALNDWPAAAQSFERAAARHDSAAAWHNLALARWELGQRDAARAAAQRALERAQAAEPVWRDAARKLVAQMKDSSGLR
jgi:tetratricopeptide (TPR) repeat protein